MTKQEFITECTDYHNKSYNDLFINITNGGISKGGVRAFSGKHIETLTKRIMKWCLNNHGITNFEIIKGDVRGKGIMIYNDGGSVSIGVDWHLFIDNELVLTVECKSYLDKCYLQRAESEFRSIKEHSKNVKTLIVSGELGVGESTLGYFMALGTVDKSLYLCDGKRSSMKPVWKEEFFKHINRDSLESVIDYINNCVRNR